MNFSEKVILITGAASGIGAETARHFARLNASLVLVDSNNDGLFPVGRECREMATEEKTVEPLLIQADLTKDEDVSIVVKRTLDRFGRLDVLANIAGVLGLSMFEDSTMEEFDRLYTINVRALYHLTLLCTPHLIASKGVIINMSSCLSHIVSPTASAYSMTKAAVDHLTKSLALELAPKGVRVNAVNPGITKTRLYDVLGSEKEKVLSNALPKVPIGWFAEPDLIAKAVVYLVSDDAKYVTGVTLRVDGGMGL